MRVSILINCEPEEDESYWDENSHCDNKPPKPLWIVTRENQGDYRSKTCHNPEWGCQT